MDKGEATLAKKTQLMTINNELFWNSFDSIERYRSSNLKINVIRPSTLLHVNNEYQFCLFCYYNSETQKPNYKVFDIMII